MITSSPLEPKLRPQSSGPFTAWRRGSPLTISAISLGFAPGQTKEWLAGSSNKLRFQGTHSCFKVWLLAVIAGLGLLVSPASADTEKIDLAGRIYTKWLYRNNDSQGILSYGNPFWPDNTAGDNGVGSEFELTVTGRVTPRVEAGARLKSRFGGLWQDWWESGDIRYDTHNTSGESLGMNHAQYVKLRGVYVRFAPPIPSVKWVHVGSTDLSMFNPWTIGKVRYIDRDNANGSFVEGAVGSDEWLRYHAGVIALPKLWVGPWWSTGIGDPNVLIPFTSNDYAYGLRLDSSIGEWTTLTVTGTLTTDLEIDAADPDTVGTLYPACLDDLGHSVPGCDEAVDHAVGTFTRYVNGVATAEAQLDPHDEVSIHALGGYSMQRLDPNLVANGVALNDGVFPVVYADTDSYAARGRLELFDPFAAGVGFRFEYFNIGEHWSSIFGARREADVLWTTGFIDGGQLPTLNLANEFVDFDEPWFESCVGWHGGTWITDYETGGLELSSEATVVTYNTNAQNRDVESVYPDFLHSDGFTDTGLYDYANTTDRGRDPRSVYRENQDRQTGIGALGARYVFDVGRGLELTAKGKLILDQDERSHATDEDDYDGTQVRGDLGVSYPFTDEFRLGLGGRVDRWFEDNRDGLLVTDSAGAVNGANYGDTDTDREQASLKMRYDFDGIHIVYYLEYIHKTQQREKEPDSLFHVVRSKGTLEVTF